MKRRNVCVVNRASPSVGGIREPRTQNPVHRRKLQPVCCSISQSGNRTEDLDWRLVPYRSVSSCSLWLLWSSCLERDSDSIDVQGIVLSFDFSFSLFHLSKNGFFPARKLKRKRGPCMSPLMNYTSNTPLISFFFQLGSPFSSRFNHWVRIF